MNRKYIVIFTCIAVAIAYGAVQVVVREWTDGDKASQMDQVEDDGAYIEDMQRGNNGQSHPMSIESLRGRSYVAGELKIVKELAAGSGYSRYIASYVSDGSIVYGLLTVPVETKPVAGFPAILFLHGYVRPDTYVATADYVNSQNALASAGFVTFKPDMRGHGKSEGEARGAHFSEYYVVDSINALRSMQSSVIIDASRIGIWGHSNGGEIGLRMLTINDETSAAVFWAGVVGSFESMLETYNDQIPFLNLQRRKPDLVTDYGLPSENPEFWHLIDPYTHLEFIDTPVQLHHGTADESVPVELSQELAEALITAGKSVEYFEYPQADHNLSPGWNDAMQRTIEFFQKNL